jgi:hypothetical protein
MCIDKEKSLLSIKKRLQLPRNWLAKTEDSVVINYYLGNRKLFLTLDRDDVPRLLKEAGMITRYEGSGSNRRMYCSEVPLVKPGNSFTAEWNETQVQCESLKIYESDVIHLIACREHEKIITLMRHYQLN